MWKSIARSLTPPFAWNAARRILRGRPEWQHVPDGFASRSHGVRGWQEESLALAQAERWPAFVESVRSPRPLGGSTESSRPDAGSHAAHNTYMTFAYALARAAQGRDRISWLDWGGGLGQYHRIARELFPDLALDYTCRDLPAACREGRRLQPGLDFVDADADLGNRKWDFVLASGALHYSDDWRSVARRLAAATAGFLLITRLPVVWSAPSFVVLQRPKAHGYDSEYFGWFLNRAEFLGVLESAGMKLEREFLIDERPEVAGAPEAGEYRGFLFAPAGARP